MSRVHRTIHILLVEDEAGDARLLRLAILRNGFDAVIHDVANGREAIGFLRQGAPCWPGVAHPDLIMIDLEMPGQSGLEFLAAVKRDEDLRVIPAIVVTSSLLEANVRAAYQLGAAGYVQKPADLQELIATVATLGEYWFRLVRLPHNGE